MRYTFHSFGLLIATSSLSRSKSKQILLVFKREWVKASEGSRRSRRLGIHPAEVSEVKESPLLCLISSMRVLSVTDRGDLALSLSLSGDVLHLRCVFTSLAFGCEMFLTARPTAASGSIFAVWEYQVLWRILLTHVPPTGCGCHSYVARVRTLRVGGQWKSFGTGVVVTCSHWDTKCRIEI